jgi:hypothetical protein
MSAPRRYQRVPLQRRWMNDIIHFGKKAHLMGFAWRVNLAPLVAARAARQPPVGWTAIWMKALALVGARRSELRTVYLPFPWARLYVHPQLVCTVPIERTWREAPALFFEQFTGPDNVALADLDDSLRRLRQVPIESVGSFRRLIRFARPPVFVRRLIWSFGLNWSGALRARHLGIAVVNPFAVGATVVQSAMPASFMIYFGLVAADGTAQVQVFYDHRIMDGVGAYKILRDLEATLNRDIVAELEERAARS